VKRSFVSALLVPVVFCVLTQPAAAETAEGDYLPKCDGAFDLCGYVARDTQAVLIPQQFERAFAFSEGLAAVRIDGLFGFIDLNGNVVIKPEFDLAGDFYQGLAEVLVGDVVGVIDRSGQFVVEPQFARAVPFTADTLIVAEGDWRNGYYPGSEKLDGLSSFFSTGGRRVGLYHISNGWITAPIFNVSLFDEPSRGLIWATTEDESSGPFGLLRADGTWQVAPAYTHVQSLTNGRAIVRGPSTGLTFTHNGRTIDPSGAVDRDGSLVVPIAFRFLTYWSGGYALAESDGLHGLVSPDGTLLAGRYFDEVERSESGNLPRVRDGEAWYSVQPDGELIQDQNEGTVIASCPSGLTIREVSGLAQFSHPSLDAPIGLLFDRKYQFYDVDCENPIPVGLNGKWGFVTQEGAVITNPPTFENIFGFQDGLAAVSLGGLWGIIDKSGGFVVAPTYSELHPADGLYRAVEDGRVIWLDARGNEVPEPSPGPQSRAQYLECADGSRFFAENDLWGLVGADGDVLIAPQYRALTCFVQGVAWGASVGGTSWCAIGPDGQSRQKPDCRAIHYPYFVTHHYPETFSEDPYESSVLWVRAFLDYGREQRETPPTWISDGVQGEMSSSIIR
jgi:WG containing repeat